MRIQAAVLRGGDLPYAIEDVELEEPGESQILVRIVGAGWCHTDLLPRSPGFLAAPPIVVGHEGAGVVERVGPGVREIRVGDHVVLSYDSCGSCVNCSTAHTAYCDTFFPRNLSGAGGDGQVSMTDETGQAVANRWFGQSCFATHSVVPARNAVTVDPALRLELLGPLGCGVQTGAGAILHALRVSAGSSVAVYGVGGVGLSAVMAARVAHAETIIVVDRNADRLALARELGATHTVHATGHGLCEAVRDASGGGTQYALDTTGTPEVIASAVDALRPTGICGLVGAPRGDLELSSRSLAAGRTVTGIVEGGVQPQSFIPRLIELWCQGRFPFDKLLTTFALEDINKAEHATLTGAVVKPVLIPSALPAR
ncbi:NAD(P)-dependent alcohol dehydrogenase [Amycolatopsis sp. NPDC059090]|uniref:NAD(P)-dependent alcohol dehydrogenase n=1 Tax=unclassified Amycolatopsis TaxID=2618356 RepID=UPI00366ED253